MHIFGVSSKFFKNLLYPHISLSKKTGKKIAGKRHQVKECIIYKTVFQLQDYFGFIAEMKGMHCSELN